jgi:hypothetical protein
LVDAVVLEEVDAKHPRVIFSAQAVDAMSRVLDAADGFIWKDEQDDLAFVGYLAAILNIPTSEYGSARQALEVHKFRVEEGLRGSAASKYVWSAAYHNAFAARHFPERSDLTVQANISEIQRQSDLLGPIEG